LFQYPVLKDTASAFLDSGSRATLDTVTEAKLSAIVRKAAS